MDTDSARVTGLGDAGLSDFTCTINHGASTASERLVELRTKEKVLEETKLICERQAGFLLKYGETLTSEHVTPEQAIAFAQAYGKQGLSSMQAVKTLDEQLAEVDREIEKELKREVQRKGTVNGHARVVIATDGDGPVQLKLTYSEHIFLSAFISHS